MRSPANDIIIRPDGGAGFGAHAPNAPLLPPSMLMNPGMLGPAGMGGRGAAGRSSLEPSMLLGIWRHFWLVILFAILGAGGAFVFLKQARPLYTAVSKLYIEPTGPKVLSEALGGVQRTNYLFTQAELMKSTPILSLAAENPAVKGLKTFEITNGDPMPYLREELETDVGRKDDLIAVSVTTPYIEEAPIIVNAIVQAYSDYQSLEKKTSSSRLLEELSKSKADSEKQLADIEAQMFDFQQKNPGMNFNTIIEQELATMSARYTQAQLASIEARSMYAAGHPNLQKAQRLEEQLYDSYTNKLKQLMDINKVNGEYSKYVTTEAQKKEFIKRLDDRIKELEVNQGAAQVFNNVEQIEPARLPDGPSFPRKNRTLAVAVLAGALLGAGLALLRDRMDGRMRSVEEIQTVIGLPILGVVPGMSGRRTAVARAMTVHLDPRSVVAEAYRTIRTAVYFGTAGSRCKTILMTSPEPGDGKTTSASNLAIAIAQTGRSVLLLDADFRKPTQHKNLDIKDSAGLSSVLAGREPLERAIQRTGVEGLDILPCGPIPANPSEILNSREFGELVDNLASRYDHIIFDSPPVNAVTDARILGAVCDATILVVRADKSTRKSGEHARNALLAVGARLLGAVVNDAPTKKGYEVYGGSYYGSPADVPVTHADVTPMTHRLTAVRDETRTGGSDDIDAQIPPRRRDSA